MGLTYYGEPVPTDIEEGRDGNLYVTTLGGGLGEQLPLGAIYRINPDNGRATRLVKGLSAPVGLALAPHRTMYFSQLFAGTISRVKMGSHRVRTFVETARPRRSSTATATSTRRSARCPRRTDRRPASS